MRSLCAAALTALLAAGCGARVVSDGVSKFADEAEDSADTARADSASAPIDVGIDTEPLPGMKDASIARVATPIIKPAAGDHGCPLSIHITTATPEASIHFTWDHMYIAADPTIASPRYFAPFELHRSAVLKARAFRDGLAPSDVAMVKYNIDRVGGTASPPAFEPGGGVYASDQTVALSSAPGATICYVVAGSYVVPMCGDDAKCTYSAREYTGPFVVSPTAPFGTRVAAQACMPCGGRSSEVSTSYVLRK